MLQTTEQTVFSPQYTLPHELNRPGQLETAEAILASEAPNVIVSAPTGSGKTAFAAYAGQFLKTLALVKTRALQKQYSEAYDFYPLYGKSSYECANPINSRPRPATAEVCLIPGDRKDDKAECRFSCPYPHHKRTAIVSQRTVLNYTKFLLDPSLTQINPDIVFLDEAHQLDGILTDFYSVTFPVDDYIDIPLFKILPQTHDLYLRAGLDMIMAGVQRLENVLNIAKLNRNVKQEVGIKRLQRKLAIVHATINNGADDYYFEEVAGRKKGERAIRVKFLTPRFDRFRHYNKVVMMSATLGNWRVFARNLGIDEQDIDYIEVPHATTAKQRIVYDLPTKAMNYKKFQDKNEVAAWGENIRKALFVADDIGQAKGESWTGLILVASYAQAETLQRHLLDNGINDALVMPRNIPTEEQLAWWIERRKTYRYLISPTFWEGVDLGQDNICIVAKIPFPPAFDKGTFDHAKREYNKQLYNQTVAWNLEQGLGRTRRGIASHYGRENGFVAIADGAWRKMKKFLSPHLLAAIEPIESVAK